MVASLSPLVPWDHVQHSPLQCSILSILLPTTTSCTHWISKDRKAVSLKVLTLICEWTIQGEPRWFPTSQCMVIARKSNHYTVSFMVLQELMLSPVHQSKLYASAMAQTVSSASSHGPVWNGRSIFLSPFASVDWFVHGSCMQCEFLSVTRGKLSQGA